MSAARLRRFSAALFSGSAVQYAVDRVEELFTLKGFFEKGPDAEGAQLVLVQPVGCVHNGNDQCLAKLSCPADLFAEQEGMFSR